MHIFNKKKLAYKYKNRFYNTDERSTESFFFGTLPSFLKSLIGRSRRTRDRTGDWVCRYTAPLQMENTLHVTWIGHSSFLVQVGMVNILIDPVFAEISAFFPRLLAPGISLDQLPPIDLILISHNHHDHMDELSLKSLVKKFPAVAIAVPLGDKNWFTKRDIFKVTEHEWCDVTQIQIGEQMVELTFLPAWHWSRRGLFDRNRSLWGSWMIQSSGSTIYFGGDTAYASHFIDIGKRFKTIDVALLPIGPCTPREWMKYSHMDARDAVHAAKDLNASNIIPMHWGTFPFGEDPFALPIEQLSRAWKDAYTDADTKKLHIVKAGQVVTF